MLVALGGLTGCGKNADELYLEAKTSLIEANSSGKKKLDEVVELYRDAAEAGSIEAALFLTQYYYDTKQYQPSLKWNAVIKNAYPVDFFYYNGAMELNGYGIKQDVKQGLQDLTKALELKSPKAAFDLGHYYELQENYDRAVEFYKLAVSQKDSRANLPLAKLYLNNLASTADFAEAFRLIKLEARKNNTEARLLLAKCYIEALGTSENLNIAESILHPLAEKLQTDDLQMLMAELKLYRGTAVAEREGLALLKKLSIEKQNPDAAYLLYKIYTTGLYGQDKNDKEALFFVRIAQKAGKPEAYLALAQMYLDGVGVERNATECFNLVSKVLEISPNYLEAIFWIGKLYAEGIGVIRNDDLGYQYISKAAARGHREAQYLRATMINSGRAKSDKDNEALQVFKKFADEGDPRSAYNYGMILYDGIGVPKNISLAIKYLKQSIDGGVPDGMFTLAEAYDKLNDQPNATIWYKVLTHNDNPYRAEANARLGEIYENQNMISDSIRFYRQAYNLGQLAAGANLGRLYFILGDFAGAKKLFEEIGDKNALAQTFLGVMYERGLGYEANEIKALEWYDKAIRNGNTDAMYLEGVLILNGKDIPEHIVASAFGLLKRSACKFNEEAALFLGYKYYPARGMLETGAGWLKFAEVKNGSSRAAALLKRSSFDEDQINKAYREVESSCHE